MRYPRCIGLRRRLRSSAWPLLAGCTGTQENAEPARRRRRAAGIFAAGFGKAAGGSENTKDIHEAAAARGALQLMFENAEQKAGKPDQGPSARSSPYQVDVIAFAPNVEDGWDKRAHGGESRGHSRADHRPAHQYGGTRACTPALVGSEFRGGRGYARGEFLLTKMKDAETREYRGDFRHDRFHAHAAARVPVFRSVLGRATNRFEIIESISGDFLHSLGKECMQGLLERHSDIDVLYSHNDEMTYGAIEAIEARGWCPARTSSSSRWTASRGPIDLLKAGKINCVVECTPLIGDVIMELAEKLAAGEPIPRDTYSVERNVFRSSIPIWIRCRRGDTDRCALYCIRCSIRLRGGDSLADRIRFQPDRDHVPDADFRRSPASS